MSDRTRSGALWVLAFLTMFAAASYQRRTGPTYEVKGRLQAAGATYDYELPRSANTTSGAIVAIPRPGTGASAVLGFRRYPTADPFTEIDMAVQGNKLTGELPVQPAAGKVEYYVDVRLAGGGGARLPGSEAGTVVLRYKDPVPIGVLLPHVLVMFLSMFIGVRAAFSALLERGGVTGLSWIAFGGITLGGMILGPIVQKMAFGAFWTGLPFGYDLTDNKTLIMWLAWLAACLIIGRPGKVSGAVSRRGRVAVLAAALIMLIVYLVPHSLRGSELDYDAGEVKVGERATGWEYL